MSHQVAPLVSICVPNRNHGKYLAERFDSILEQTYPYLEILVCDGRSEDGSWKLIQSYAKRDQRITCWQEPPTGIYNAWNACLARSSGAFIYFATSDDTMEPRCIEHLLRALKSQSDPCIAQCRLTLIDENSAKLPEEEQWERTHACPKSLGTLMGRYHVRKAPVDARLLAATGSVYTSHTQILVDRRIYDRIGIYENRWGTKGDFHWCLKASLLFDTVFVPLPLATWRMHDEQASRHRALAKDGVELKSMIEDAYAQCLGLVPDLESKVRLEELLNDFLPFFVATQMLGAPGVLAKLYNALRYLVTDTRSFLKAVSTVAFTGHIRRHREDCARRILKEFQKFIEVGHENCD